MTLMAPLWLMLLLLAGLSPHLGAQPNSICTQLQDRPSLDIEWRWAYKQTGPNRVVPEVGIKGFSFKIFQDIDFSEHLSILGGTVTVPSVPPREEMWGGSFLTTLATNEAALLTAYPPGSYEIQVVLKRDIQPDDPWAEFFSEDTTFSSFSANLTVPEGSEPDVPRLENFAAAQSIDPNQDFVLEFSPFSSPQQNRIMSVSLRDDKGFFLLFFPTFRDCSTLKPPLVTRFLTIPSGMLQRRSNYTLFVAYSLPYSEFLPKIGPLSIDLQLYKQTEVGIATVGAPGPVEPDLNLEIQIKDDQVWLDICTSATNGTVLVLAAESLAKLTHSPQVVHAMRAKDACKEPVKIAWSSDSLVYLFNLVWDPNLRLEDVDPQALESFRPPGID